MSTERNARRRMALGLVFTSAVAGLSWRAEGTLTVNQWTGNAGTTQWSNAGNWLGGNIPDSTDQAVVYNATIGLNAAPPSVGGVLLGDVGSSATVYTEGFKLNVLGTTDLEGGTIVAQAAPSGSFSLQTPALTMNLGAELTMIASNAYVRVSSTTTGTANGTLSVDATSYIYTDGTLDTGTYTNNGDLFADGASTVNATTFTMAGTSSNPATIYPEFGNSLTMNASTFNLTDFNSTINVGDANSTLNMNGSMSGNVGATITVGDTATLAFNPTANIGYYSKFGNGFVSHGNVTLNGGPTIARAATITGGAFFSNVTVNGYGNLPGAEFDAANVTVAAGSYLYLGGGYFRGTGTSNATTFNGPGTVNFNGATQIGYSSSGIPYTTVNINAGTLFNWDGTSGSNASCNITNGELDIYASTIDTSLFFPGYYGALTVTGGALLNVAGTPWTLYGTMTLGPGAVVQGQTLSVSAASVPAGSYSLMPTSSGTTFPVIQAPFVIYTNSYIYMGFNGGLHLDGPTTWAGGQVTSAPYISGNPPYGTFVQDGNATVTANSTIFCDVLDMDGTANAATWTVNPGVTFNQEAFYLDSAGSTTNPFHSTLTLNGGTINMQTGSGVWTLAGGTINMNQSSGQVPFVNGSKLVLGSGASAGTINVAPSSAAQINAALESAATSVSGGNVIQVGSGSTLYIGALASDANAVMTKGGPGSLFITGAQSHSTGSQLIVTQGAVYVDTDAGAGGANLTLNASGGTTLLTTAQHLYNLKVGTGALVYVVPQGSPPVLVTTLNMSGGTLDLTTSDMICQTGNLHDISQSLKSGYKNGGWNGSSGILSSYAAIDTTHLHALGFIQNKNGLNTPLYPTFEGQSSVTTDVLIKYTWYGDADLNGKVDGSDYSRIDAAYASDKITPGLYTGWYNGDFNYDGTIDGSDYTLMDNAYNLQGAQISAQIASPTALVAGNSSAVPEPAVGFVLMPIVAMLSRRRSRQNLWR